MERTAENRVVFGAGIKKKKSRNPHGYWIFRWRKRWDSNPRAREGYLISSQARYDHFDTLPYMSTRHFPDIFCKEKLLERTDGKNCKIFGFSNCVTPPETLDFRWTKLTLSRKFSSQARYDHFNTSP